MASQGEKEKRPKAPTNSTSFFSATQFFEHQTPPPPTWPRTTNRYKNLSIGTPSKHGTILDSKRPFPRQLLRGYTRRNICRVLSRERLRRHLYASPTLAEAPTLDITAIRPIPSRSAHNFALVRAGKWRWRKEDRDQSTRAARYSPSPVLEAYHRAVDAGTLLRIPFTTVTEYLFMLRDMSRLMRPLGRRECTTWHAAVSDFYVAPEHKIQSGKGSLVIEMDQVPKVLKPMVQQWAPEGYIVSFKLETDQNLLIPKLVPHWRGTATKSSWGMTFTGENSKLSLSNQTAPKKMVTERHGSSCSHPG
ncbi:hypothetical protein L7F22_023056 [Adiantum nelumboides]|nr:hypothetical protein [Adiantum nelumboides]